MKDVSRFIDRIMGDPDICDSGKIQTDLLREFHRGYPVENLRAFLKHGNDKIVKMGIFIASELGSKAMPLLKELVHLLTHPAMVVRYDAIDSLLTCTTSRDGDAIAAVVSLVYDKEGAVRRKVMDFLQRASQMQLNAGLRYLEKHNPLSIHIVGLKGLSGDAQWDAVQSMAVMNSKHVILRKYGVVAAARMDVENSDALVFASANDDEDVRCFAGNVLELRQV
jgi:hypothetical protein